MKFIDVIMNWLIDFPFVPKIVKNNREPIIQFVKFGTVGFFNTILAYLLTNFFYYILLAQLPFLAARDALRTQCSNFITFMITVYISFLLNGHYVFAEESNAAAGAEGELENRTDKAAAGADGGKPAVESKRKAFWKPLLKVYASYSITSLFLNGFLLYLEVNIFGVPYYIATLLNMCITIPLNFILNKFWAYK